MTKEKKIIWTRWWMIVIYCFVGLMIIGAFNPDTESNQNQGNLAITDNVNSKNIQDNSEAKTNDEPQTNQLTTEQQIQQDVQKILGSDKIKDLTYYEGAGLLIINYKASDYSSEITLQNDHIRIYEKIFEDYDAEDISIFSWMIFIDTYGQEKEMVGVRSSTTKTTANKINWDNLITDNLPKVADTYYIHPALID